MQSEEVVTEFLYSIDGANTITSVSDDWERFAVENGAPGLSRGNVVGRSLWDFVGDLETRYLYELVFDRVRNSGISRTFPFRCDSPGCRRYMELRISPSQRATLQLSGRLLREEARPHLELLDPDIERGAGLIRLCGWCKCVKVGEDDWREVEDAVANLGLFGSVSLPGISHVTCPNCAARAREVIRSQARSST